MPLSAVGSMRTHCAKAAELSAAIKRTRAMRLATRGSVTW